jgi:hypothetical protein
VWSTISCVAVVVRSTRLIGRKNDLRAHIFFD